ncbi:PAC2 family protein [Georgenia sp. TF02-10]|uniref:proteasome assembly chaperone family protein n=1 Tax=Georgenia sp. TF02-10 TaxID=2917725 RepID=UPI001FA6CAEA|nr:PAC2 family protein [Georgenia sp. TF02-10]UNX55965.1 PAC2 family protein [Georgenia sp. TF02-10]
MRDPLFTLSPGAQDAAPVPVLVHALRGGLDAGNAGALAAQHLLESLPAERVATFDSDALVDYRSRRPPLTFADGQFSDYEDPVIALDLLRDDEGNPLLLLHGPEPDLRWDGFVDAVTTLVETLGVQRTIGVHGIPMAVPHTRPTTVTAHATRAGLVRNAAQMLGTIQVPGSVAGLLELRLGRAGHDAVGFSANVPHYLAQSEYPQAAAELVRQVARNADLALPVGELEAAAADVAQQIATQVAASAEVGAVVSALERQYDAYVASAAQPGQTTLLADPGSLPTGDQIGAELEAFLAEQAGGDEPRPGQPGPDQHRTDQAGADQPGTDQAGADQPGTDQADGDGGR